jgi:hypothetical protein
MIIESGSDIHDLLFDGCELRLGELRMAALDADLRPRWTGTLTTEFRTRIEGRAVDVVDELLATDPLLASDDRIRFVVFAHAVPEVDANGRTRDRLDREQPPRLARVLSRFGVTSLGIVVCDGTHWTGTTTGPFADSSAGDEVPRVAVLRGPHPFFTCDCALCVVDRAQSVEEPGV